MRGFEMPTETSYEEWTKKKMIALLQDMLEPGSGVDSEYVLAVDWMLDEIKRLEEDESRLNYLDNMGYSGTIETDTGFVGQEKKIVWNQYGDHDCPKTVRDAIEAHKKTNG